MVNEQEIRRLMIGIGQTLEGADFNCAVTSLMSIFDAIIESMNTGGNPYVAINTINAAIISLNDTKHKILGQYHEYSGTETKH